MRAPDATASERRFYTGMAIAMLLTVLVGFSRSFYLRPLFPDNPAVSYPMVYVHGALFSLWVILFVVQVGLVRKRSIARHRQLGLAAGLLAVLLVVQGLSLAISAVRTGRIDERFGDALPLILPVADVVLFSTFVGLGFLTRARPQAHKRWMLLATLNFIGPAISRLPGGMALGEATPLLVYAAFVGPLVVWDVRSRRKPHPVTIIGGLGTLVSLPLRFILSETTPWQTFERWVLTVGV